MSQVGDFRRGALNVVWRKCGKANCACAQPGHRGHGPQYNLTRRVGGKTVNTHLKPGPELEKAQREVAEHQRFLELVEEVTVVSEAICAARPVTGSPVPPPAEGERGARGGPRGDRRRRGRQAGRARRAHAGAPGAALGVLEQAMRAALTAAGARLLQAVLAGEDGYAGPRAGCGRGHQAVYAGSRPKTITTVLGPVQVTRAWYHCAACGHGFAPRDQQLGISRRLAVTGPGRDDRPGRRRGFLRPRRRAAGRPGRHHRQRQDGRAVRRGHRRGRPGSRRGRGRRDPRQRRSARCPRKSQCPTCCMSRPTAPACPSAPARPRAARARPKTARPAPGRSSSPGCSPCPGWTATAGR